MTSLITYSVFDGDTLVFRGSLNDIVLKIKRKLGRAEHNSMIIFSDQTGAALDFNFHGTEKDVLKRLEVFVSPADADSPQGAGPGRPKLGVVSREVSLLPRHWEWLATQSGGTSGTLRRLVEEAKKKSSGTSEVKQSQERTYKFMSAIAGNQPNFEEVLRALYKRDEAQFKSLLSDWPRDIKKHVLEFAKPAFFMV